jgi:crotonobetainyl-CoA:carnitine CoA-transferase CaiB-like acyl-CoA transferase
MLENQMNRGEWPKLRQIIEDAFKQHPAVHLKAKFKATDACVTEVVNEIKSLKKKVFKGHIVVEETASTSNKDPIWGRL